MRELLRMILDFFKLVWRWIGDIESNLSGILAIVGILMLLGGVARWVWRQIQQRRQTRIPFNTFAFEVIASQCDVLQAVYGGEADNLLADRNIPYQNRQADRNTQRQLQDLLEEHRWLLITGQTGIGKTREAAELAQAYNDRDWTVLKFRETVWLDEPSYALKDKVGTDRKLLFFLDDLNKAVHRRDQWLRPSNTNGDSPTEAIPLPPIPLQERLLRFLEHCERECRAEEIRVIATARDEKESLVAGEPSEWDKLEFEKYPLWKRFFHYSLPQPDNEAIVDLLRTMAPQVGMDIVLEDCARIANRNDRTFRNIVQNLSDASIEQCSLSPQTFTDTLTGSWAKHYNRAIRKYPAAVHIYNAIDLLRSMRIDLYPYTAEPTARLMAGGNWLQQLQHRWQIHRTLKILIAAETILQPRDGQIEAKGAAVDVEPYIPALTHLLLKLVDHYPQALQGSMVNFGVEASSRNNNREALVLFDRFLIFAPDSEIIWYNRGIVLDDLGRYQEAVDSYDKAIQSKSDFHEAWYNRGTALSALGQYQEAVNSYDKAIQFKLDKYEAWYNRGTALDNLERHQEAVDSYDKVIQFKPDLHEAWNNRGTALSALGRYQEAVNSYDKAIQFKLDLHEAWNNRGTALSALGRYQEAVNSYDKAIQFKPDYHEAWYNRGVDLFGLGHKQAAIDSYNTALEFKPDKHEAWGNRGNALTALRLYEAALASYDKVLEIKPDDINAWYAKARCWGLQGEVEQAVVHLQRAIELNPDCREAVKKDADFDGIREDDRFQLLIGNGE